MTINEPVRYRLGAATLMDRFRANATDYFALLTRRRGVGRMFRVTAPVRLVVGTVVLVCLVLMTMVEIDAWSISVVVRLPLWLTEVFDHITDFGRSAWFLLPLALILMLMAALASPALPLMSQRVLAAIAVRLGFLFCAIALPGLVFTIVKRLIGRARPLVGAGSDPFLYLPLGWKVEYASFPSGHATDAFAAATAIGALWPKTRPLMWTYAVLIALSRVMVTAHFPSDVLAGAIAGTLGALLVRGWFAARRLAFTASPDHPIKPMPGPSFARLRRVFRELIAASASRTFETTALKGRG
jgi:membrane-associated phospholipid phosphatase